MVRELNKVTTLTGKSGKKYEFFLWSFDEFDDIQRTFKGSGLYLFTNRHKDERGVFKHSYIYLGETGDYFTRYDNHHKEKCIVTHNSNCIGFYSMPNSSEEERIDLEDDLLAAYFFPCNKADN